MWGVSGRATRPGVSMLDWRRNLLWTWLSLFLAMTGFAYAFPIIPFFLVDRFGLERESLDFYVGAFAFAGNLGFLICAPIWGKLSDIYGRRMMMTRANLFSGILMPLLAFIPSVNMLIVLRFFIGAFAGVVAATITLVAGFTPKEHRGVALGAVSSAIFSGNLAGTVIGGLLAHNYGFTVTFILCGVQLLVAAYISHFMVKEHVPEGGLRPRSEFRITLKIPHLGAVWFIMALTMGMGCAQMMDAPFIPILVKDVLGENSGEALLWNSYLGAASSAAGIVGGFVIGHLADRLPGHKVGIVICVAGAVLLLPQAWVSSMGSLFGERMALVFFISGLSPIMQTWLSLVTPDTLRGTYFGFATSSRAVGWLVGGLISTTAAYFLGTRAVFVAGALLLLLLAYCIHLVHKKIPFPSK